MPGDVKLPSTRLAMLNGLRFARLFRLGLPEECADYSTKAYLWTNGGQWRDGGPTEIPDDRL